VSIKLIHPQANMKPSPHPCPLPPAYLSAILIGNRRLESLPPTFAGVTAHNPDGVIASPAFNAHAHAALVRRAEHLGILHFPITGASPDRTHQEAGLGLDNSDLKLVAAIAAEFRQIAFYWIESNQVFLACDGSGFGWRIASLADRYFQE